MEEFIDASFFCCAVLKFFIVPGIVFSDNITSPEKYCKQAAVIVGRLAGSDARDGMQSERFTLVCRIANQHYCRSSKIFIYIIGKFGNVCYIVFKYVLNTTERV